MQSLAKKIFTSAVLSATLLSPAIAAPHLGFSLNAGYASHTRSCNGCTVSSTSGLSIGMDYQFPISDRLSASPFLMSSSESSSGYSVGHGIIGGQLRYWQGDMFVGAHIGSYGEYVSINNSSSISANGLGTGLVVGWEDPKGGLYVMGQLDSANMNYPGSTVGFTAFRVSTGFRWK